MHPTLMHEIARYRQADLLREAERARLAAPGQQQTGEAPGAAGCAGASARPSSRRSDGSGGRYRAADAATARRAASVAASASRCACRTRSSPGMRDEVRRDEAGGGARRGLGENRRGSRVLGAAAAGVLRRLGAEQARRRRRTRRSRAAARRRCRAPCRSPGRAPPSSDAPSISASASRYASSFASASRSTRERSACAWAETPLPSSHSSERRAAEAIRPAAIAITTPETAPAPGAGDGPGDLVEHDAQVAVVERHYGMSITDRARAGKPGLPRPARRVGS